MMKLKRKQLLYGEWYYEFDEETRAYHIYHTESDHSPYSYASEQEAENKATELNDQTLKENMKYLGDKIEKLEEVFDDVDWYLKQIELTFKVNNINNDTISDGVQELTFQKAIHLYDELITRLKYEVVDSDVLV